TGNSHDARSCAQLLADQSNRGALLECRDQRRGGGAHHDINDAHDRRPEDHEQFSHPRWLESSRLDDDGSDGCGRGDHVSKERLLIILLAARTQPWRTRNLAAMALFPRYTIGDNPMNKDRIKGSAEQAKGKVKEVAGKATGDKKARNRRQGP